MPLTPNQLLVLFRDLLENSYQTITTLRLSFKKRLYHKYIQIVATQIIELLSHPTLSDDQLRKELQVLLHNNWQLIKGTPFSYVALPNEPITCFLAELALWIRDTTPVSNSVENEPYGLVSILMPTISTESIHESHPHLGPTQDPLTDVWSTDPVILVELLQTHILDHLGNSLLPIKLLATCHVEDKPQDIVNPYFNFQHPEAMSPFLSVNDYERLIMHSDLTIAVEDARKRYQATLQQDQNNLFTQLMTLRAALAKNDAHGGSGRNNDAGKWAYPAIIAFIEYYNALDRRQIETIPLPVKEEIDALIKYSTDISANLVEHEDTIEMNIESCIGTRGEQLAVKMHPFEAELIAITSHDPLLITDAKHHFNKAQAELLRQLEAHQYIEGCDKPDLTRPLIEKLGLPFSITSMHDLEDIQELSINEIIFLFSEPAIIQATLYQLKNINNFTSICYILSLERLDMLIQKIQLELPKLLDYSSATLSNILKVMNHERSAVIFSYISESLSLFIQSPQDFITIVKALHQDQGVTAYLAVEEKLKSIILSSPTRFMDFYAVLNCLNFKQKQMLYQACFNDLPKFIQTQQDFAATLPYLKVENYQAYYLALKNKLGQIIKIDNHFIKTCFSGLNSVQNSAFYDAICPDLHLFITSHTACNSLFRYIDAERYDEAYLTIKPLFPSLLRTTEVFCTLLETLNPDERIDCYQTLKKRFIKSMTIASTRLPDQFNKLLHPLAPTERADLYHHLKKHLRLHIHSADDLSLCLIYLPMQQRLHLYEKMRPQFPTLIKTVHDFIKVINCTDANNRSGLVEQFSDQLPSWLYQSATHYKGITKPFNNVLKYLNEEQRDKLYNSMKAELPSHTRTATEFAHVLEYLNSTQKNEVILPLEENFQHFLKSVTDPQEEDEENVSPDGSYFSSRLNTVFRHLDNVQREKLFNNNIAILATNIATPTDIINTFQYLDNRQRSMLYDLIKPRIIDIVGDFTPAKFIELSYHLNQQHYYEQYQLWKSKLHNSIITLYEFQKIALCTPADEFESLCQSIKHINPKLFSSSTQLKETLKMLSGNLRQIIYKTWSERFIQLTPKIQNLSDSLQYIEPEQCKAMCIAFMKLNEKFSPSIKSLILILEPLEVPQRKIVFETLTITTLSDHQILNSLFLIQLSHLDLQLTSPQTAKYAFNRPRNRYESNYHWAKQYPLIQQLEIAIAIKAENLKTIFDTLITQINPPKSGRLKFFESRLNERCKLLVKKLSELSIIEHVITLSHALGLSSRLSHLSSPKRIECHLTRYIEALQRPVTTANLPELSSPTPSSFSTTI